MKLSYTLQYTFQNALSYVPRFSISASILYLAIFRAFSVNTKICNDRKFIKNFVSSIILGILINILMVHINEWWVALDNT